MKNLPISFVGEFAAATKVISMLPTIAIGESCLYTAAILGSAARAIAADLSKLADFGINAAKAEATAADFGTCQIVVKRTKEHLFRLPSYPSDTDFKEAKDPLQGEAAVDFASCHDRVHLVP